MKKSIRRINSENFVKNNSNKFSSAELRMLGQIIDNLCDFTEIILEKLQDLEQKIL